MHALIVVAHPEQDSLTHAVAAEVAEGLIAAQPGHSVEIADLLAEGFDPVFNRADQALFRGTGELPAEIAAEQARIDRADALVLVFPVYWWAMPALLKGWIDRVFASGWAYGMEEGKVLKKLHGLRVHLVGLAGADAGTFDRRGYANAMHTQIEHGIFDYCGAQVLSSSLMFDAQSSDPVEHLARARRIGQQLFVTP